MRTLNSEPPKDRIVCYVTTDYQNTIHVAELGERRMVWIALDNDNRPPRIAIAELTYVEEGKASSAPQDNMVG